MFVVEVSIDHASTKIRLESRNLSSYSSFTIAVKQSLSLGVDFGIDCFEYLDEEGDNVLVRTEDEFQSLLQSVLDGRLKAGTEAEPLKVKLVLRKKSVVAKPSLSLSVADRNQCEEQMDTADPEDLNDLVMVSRSQRAQVDSDLTSTSLLGNTTLRSEDLHPIMLLGSGHSGSVFKALDVRSDRFVAVKSIALDVATPVKEQILSELNILYQCSSPFIIGFYGADFIDNRISIYTEYMDVGSFDLAVKRSGKIPEPIIGAAAVAVVSGLCYLWKMKIMHRDVKPSNILVNSAGDVKLCDFGVSVQLANSIAKSYVGTSVYMAPERLLGNEYTIRSDVWSLGLTLLEMVLGRFPYSSSNKLDQRPVLVLERIVSEEPPSLPASNFGPELRDFISTCLQKEPERRPTFDELSRHVLVVLNEPFNRAAVAEWTSRILSAP